MEITEVRVFMREGQDKKLKAYATITIDNAFVVRNVKVIEGNKGLFVAMPSRKMKEPCPKCGFRNVVRSKFCNSCGSGLPMTEPRPQAATDDMPHQSEHKDIAHPITAECREYIQKKVLAAYEAELRSPAGKPSFAPRNESPKSEPPKPGPQQAAPGYRPSEDIEGENDIEL